TYDSLGQLIAATGRESAHATAQSPQLPELQPLSDDPSLLRNYTQTFVYDEAGNLTQLRHVNGHRNWTRNMAVARFSNRVLPERDGVIPDEAQVIAGFDFNGNLQQLEPGQQLVWDSYSQLHKVTSVVRNDGLDDCERYIYGSDGQRVRKLTSAQVKSVTHSAQVRYLPGLEIRTDSRSGEELHVLITQSGHGNVRMLHWEAGKPSALANDQVRYRLDNHLGSASLEVDAQARLLSREEYYPFGGTACRAGRNAVEAKYKIIRYSGKERDASGLYYYGLRYYAPWLARWTSCDPGWLVDGLNLYESLRANPANLRDLSGLQSVGELIEAKALQAVKEERYVGGYLWSLLDVTWNVFGAEGVSKIAAGRASTGDYVSAGVEVLSVIPVGKIAKAGKGLFVGKGAAKETA
ncbi:MAG: RHS repeat protein, partial [Alphaproteobacteria bacterium]